MSKGTKRELSHVFTSVYYNRSFYNWTKYPNHCILINILDKSNLDLKATYFGCISFLSYTVFILPWQSPYPPEDKVRSVTFRWETQLALCGLRVLQKLMTMMMITGSSGNSYISWPLKKKILRDVTWLFLSYNRNNNYAVFLAYFRFCAHENQLQEWDKNTGKLQFTVLQTETW